MPTFEAPIFAKARQRTTNDGPTSATTIGAVVLTQTFGPYIDSGNETLTIARVPAGSHIVNVRTIYLAGSSPVGSGSVNVTFTPDGGTGVIIGTITVPGVAANATGVGTWVPASASFNIGTIEGNITYGPEGIATGTTSYIAVDYVMRNQDGSLTAQGSGLSN